MLSSLLLGLSLFPVSLVQKQHCCICGVCLQSQCHITGFQRALQVPGELAVSVAALPQPQPGLSGNQNLLKCLLCLVSFYLKTLQTSEQDKCNVSTVHSASAQFVVILAFQLSWVVDGPQRAFPSHFFSLPFWWGTSTQIWHLKVYSHASSSLRGCSAFS